MPIYEYECKACGHVFDVLQKLSDIPLTDCPDCNEPSLRKLLSAPNFRLKGGGWYETDFKDKNKRNLAGDSDKPDSAAASDKADKPKEAKEAKETKAPKADSAGKTEKKVSGSEK